ncbi:hypothetical protein D3C77_628040 [compost metagenome]
MSIIYDSDWAEQRLHILERDLDDELARLFEAMQKEDAEIIELCKEKLRKIRIELIQLEW